MKLTKKLEAEILKAYHAMIDANFSGDIKTFASFLDNNVTVYGSAAGEMFTTKKEAVKYYQATADQVTGKAELRKRSIGMKAIGDTVVINEQCDMYVLAADAWMFYGHTRITAIFEQKGNSWKVIHMHGSFPDSRTENGEQIATEKIKTENLQLRQAVQRRTVELESKNKELQIEAALERVRTVAMAMKKADDMLDICKTIAQQLKQLGINEIRNVQTAIFYESRGTYMNYEYYAKHDKTFITDVDYKNHKIQLAFAKKMMKGANEEVLEHLKGKKLHDWYAYQKTTNQFADKYLLKADSLNYYWYSLGPVALGTSAYYPLTKEETDLFKRFLKVFELAYLRYLDIEKAETQAREAQIEASMERVRSRTMAMQKSEELREVAVLLYNELKSLGITQQFFEAGYVEIDEVKKIQHGWMTTPAGDFLEPFDLPLTGEPVFDARYEAWKQRVPVFLQVVEGTELKRHLEYAIPLMGNKEAEEIAKTQVPDRIIFYSGNFSDGYLAINSGTPMSTEAESLLARFTRVFEQTYKRFLDLQKAEAQARDSQIQLALERVRARTMAMQNSEELAEVSYELNKQVVELGIPTRGCAFNIYNDHDSTEWFSNLEGTIPVYKTPRENIFLKYYEAGQRGETLWIEEFSGERIKVHYKYLSTLSVVGKKDDTIKESVQIIPEYQIDHVAYFKYGYLLFITLEPAPQAHEVFKRFAKEFEQTYTRFLDLQNAEAQAREAQIEAALERVRASSMAMHKSEELKEVALTVLNQIEFLGIPVLGGGITISDHQKGTYISYFADTNLFGKNLLVQTRELVTNEFWLPRELGELTNQGEQEITLKANEHKIEEWIEFVHNNHSPERATKIRNANLKEVYFHLLSYHPEATIITSSLKEFNEETWSVMRRLGKTFTMSYKRFEDLKKAEAQAYEAKIEASLERIRSRSLAMYKSNELSEVSALVFKELFGFSDKIKGSGIVLCDREHPEQWMCSTDLRMIPAVHIPKDLDIPIYNLYKAWDTRQELFYETLNKDEVMRHSAAMMSLPEIKAIFDSIPQSEIQIPEAQTNYAATFKQGYLLVITEFPVESASIFPRFARVFEQTYTRFLDLQKAEAQAREAQIEAALERVRSRTMAMQKHHELQVVMAKVFEELQILGFQVEACSIIIFNKENNDAEYWFAGFEGKGIPRRFYFPYVNHPYFHAQLDPWHEGVAYNTVQYSGELKNSMQDLFEQHGFYEGVPQEVKQAMKDWDGWHTSNAYMSHGLLGVAADGPLPDDKARILQRFAKVFEQTYTRFLDLQKAEAQAREAQIQLALERVRARTMAMQKSIELSEVVGVLYTQLESLNFGIDQVLIAIFDRKMKSFDWWSRGFGIKVQPMRMSVPTINHPVPNWLFSSLENGTDYSVFELKGEQKKSWDEHLFHHTDLKNLPEQVKEMMKNTPGIFLCGAFIKHGSIEAAGPQPLTEKQAMVLKRFAAVFEQSYTRFLDLQKAEAQAREAQIEAALERVRSRTMAMQHSDELLDVASIVFQQVKALGVPQWDCGVNIWNKGDTEFTYYPGTHEGKILPSPCKIPLMEHSVFRRFHESRMRGDDLFIYEKQGKEQTDHYQYMLSLPVLGQLLQSLVDAGLQFPTFQIDHLANFAYGNLIFITYEHCPEMHDVFKRFAKVFEQTYTRFLDLQKAESQAREAIKRASVDRVRAEIASMRTTSDLDRITPLIWNELTTLGVPFIRCGVFIMDEEQQQVHTYLSNPEGEAIAAFHQPYNTPGEIAEVVKSWRKKQMYTQHWDQARFVEFTKNLVQQGAITSGEKYLTENRPTDLYLHFLPFLQGMLYVGNTAALSDDALQLVQNLADAFSTAYARYEDFNKLEAAKEQVDKTLTDLKQAQSQLVQAEKMASLGELTAGIAHEIQNPLNFVNNFSELSNELIEEMQEEMDKGNNEEAKQIATDIRSNLEKINLHGKRADAIVKGMLQHSRTTSGEKQPTDINALADEFLRLAYHGLRAKDKSFNATLKTAFDTSIGKVSVISQDIGRVLLNLINNAFYAVTEKSKQAGDGYEPLVVMRTRKLSDKIEISVSDNGNGIPPKILDKIFQPFFTTKPTGQGTGLGLSLSYDIVKAHGGELRVETTEGEGSEFVIQLPVV